MAIILCYSCYLLIKRSTKIEIINEAIHTINVLRATGSGRKSAGRTPNNTVTQGL
jgi:hypothetical protein